MSPAVFRTHNPKSEQRQTHALDHSATGTSNKQHVDYHTEHKIVRSVFQQGGNAIVFVLFMMEGL